MRLALLPFRTQQHLAPSPIQCCEVDPVVRPELREVKLWCSRDWVEVIGYHLVLGFANEVSFLWTGRNRLKAGHQLYEGWAEGSRQPVIGG